MYRSYCPPPRFELPPRAELLGGLRQGLLLGAAFLALILPPNGSGLGRDNAGAPLAVARQTSTDAPRLADFRAQPASEPARRVANWAVASGDHRAMPFVILDKLEARVFVFDAQGRLLGASPVLLGAAVGDDSVAGIGKRPIAEVRPEERTTPAGRFIAEPGRNSMGEDVIWVDYDAAVSMHRVRALEPSERRLERLASPSPADNRISYGCINVPQRFYEAVLRKTFRSQRGVVYVLPEVKALDAVFDKLPSQRAPVATAQLSRR
ncbi:hypothetical protein [Roseateles cavernae]|uniref:hypothetical protein n=1 Tax=Roseateles cavernae TaxID=3153578 RepID=UPI0032E48D22